MAFGRFGTFPFRFGGVKPLARVIYDDINRALGTGFDISEDSTVTAETSAEARIIAAAWHANERAANQYDPDRMTDFLPRWEAIFGLTASVDDTLLSRRNRVKAKFIATGDPNEVTLYNFCQQGLGPVFHDVVYTDTFQATMRWPGNGGTDDDWYSTTAHILIQVTRPVGMAEPTFWATCDGFLPLLRDFLPDWTTISWGTLAVNGTEGFYLDEPNLDSETFAT